MQPHYNLWIEIDSEVALSIWRVNLLKAIGETGSISGAAAVVGVHYRTAWKKIHEMEARLGVKLITTQTGGEQGGGATLTPLAVEYITLFDHFAAAVEQAVQTAYHAHFDKRLPPD
jgi:molybdate transport system regulatory protein